MRELIEFDNGLQGIALNLEEEDKCRCSITRWGIQ